MKKFALGIFSVFIILGGVLLSGCSKKVSLSVSEKEVVLFTNYENAENNKSKEIEVDIKNSKVGVNVEIVHGHDCVEIDRSNTTKKKANGKYAFKILTKEDKNSGDAQIKVTSIEDSKKYEYINVTVNTVVEDLKITEENSEQGKSNLFVVKGVEKELVTTQYFDLLPVHANIVDVDWTFENGEKQLFIDDILCGEIVGTKLIVSKEFPNRKIELVASYVVNRDISRKITLEVLEDSTIRNYSVEDHVFYRNGNLQTTQATISLKRNNSNFSSAQGTLVLDVSEQNNLYLNPVVYKRVGGKPVLMTREEFENYFIFDYTERDNAYEGTKTYNITIDAIDNSAKNIFGEFEIYLQVDYAGFNYSVSTRDVKLVLDISYTATIVELSDVDGYSINNTFQDVFSSYETGLGYEINTVIGPTDVAVDDRYFRISIDTNQEALKGFTDSISILNPVGDLAEFYTQDGSLVQFTKSAAASNIYISNPIESGTKVFVKGCEKYDEVPNVEFKFESRSNNMVNTSVYFTFFKIAEDKNMIVSSATEDDLEEVTFLSSSVYSDRKIEYKLKISGIATDSGLNLCHDEANGFEYSELALISKSGDNDEESFVVVSFSVKLTSYNFADVSTFWFEHITGKRSPDFKVETFVPIESLTIQNSDKSSANVFIDKSETQDFVLNDGQVESDSTKSSPSLSKLMLEAGTSLPIYTSFQNATLTQNGISYKYLPFETLKMILSLSSGITDAVELERMANEVFASGDLSVVANSAAFMHFLPLDGQEAFKNAGFSISQDMLMVSNSSFKGYVAVIAEGYDENHEASTIVRFFGLESFYSVRYLSSNVRTTLLYTADTLSLSDINRSFVDVSISMRQDQNVPTYSDSLEYFTFTSALQDFYEVSESRGMWKNDFYNVSSVALSNNGRNLTFRISAKSTNLQTSVKDVLKIVYRDKNGFEKISEIQIEIRNVKRLESVQWVNKTVDNEIYLNLTTSNASEKNFTISTSVEPSDANDIGLTSLYVASSGSSNDIKISTSSIGQIFNVNINTTKGGKGDLYLLPNDMVKNVDGFNHILVYKYVENEDGTITEIPINIPLSSLSEKYDEIISGSEEISNYFYNNEREKVYYKNIILKIAITIADGNSEGTAIRVYNQGDLEEIDYAKYYRVMNDITLSGWKAYDQFNGMIYSDDENITLKFTNGSENFVNTLNGTLKNLTFVGEAKVGTAGVPVQNAGFIASSVSASGRIENCDVDVYYSSADNNYYGSKLNAFAANVGMIAGANAGAVVDSYVYGGSINATNGSFVGGLVGENNGLVSESGFEFYKFENGGQVCNSIITNGSVGGLVGFAGGTSVVEKSYVYAYALATVSTDDETGAGFSRKNIIQTEGFVGAFAGGSLNGAKFSQVFGFLGDVEDAFVTSDSAQFVTIENSYISYFDGEKICSKIFKNVSYSYSNSTQIFEENTTPMWTILTDKDGEIKNENGEDLNLDADIWNLEKIDSEINFGYIYLKNVAQSIAVNLTEIHVENGQSDYDGRYQVLNSGNKAIGTEEFETGVLFVYNPINQVVDVQEKAMLDRLNTISVSDLFGITAEQAKGLLLTSESRNVSISANSIRLLNSSLNEFEISVHSKMDFTQAKIFKFVILNVLPNLTTMTDQIAIKDNQTILLQTGSSRTIVYSTLSSIYLNGSTPYALNKDDFTIEYSYLDDEEGKDFVGVTRSSNSIVVTGLKKHVNNNRTTIYTNLSHNSLSEKEGYENYATAVNDKISRTFDARVYNGAKKLEVTNANNLIVRPSEYATFDVVMETDEESDGLVFSLNYGEMEVSASAEENWMRFDVDSNLALEVSWAKISSVENAGVIQNRYNVFVRVSEDTKHLVAEDYSDLELNLNASSQIKNTTYLRKIKFKVETQKIEDFSISVYAVERRQIRNSILYLTPSSQIMNTISPASDAIVSVSVTPQYAKMTHFTLTYEVAGGAAGSVGLSKLINNPLYGYYVNSSATTIVPNGIRVNLTEADKTGDGLFYFRLYVSSSFASTSGIRLVTTFYNGDEVLKVGSQPLTVDYMQDAVVRVNDSTTYLLAKGETATVTVKLGLDQNLYDLYLQNNESKISLSTTTISVVGNYKLYTAELSAGVDAKLVGGKSSGIFYVCASVERVLNNIQEVKTARATVCLVDFSVDTKNISVQGSGSKRTYNGKSYDVFYTYLNDSSELQFNYPLLPEEYNYDRNDADAVKAVAELTAKRNQFASHNYFYDRDVGYFINYTRNMETGEERPITLKEQLWYSRSESDGGRDTKVYNSERGTLTQNDFFSIKEETLHDGSTRIVLSGKRAGIQLMRLDTIVNYQGVEIESHYYFLVVVDVWTDEESPTQITTAKEFVDFATNSPEAGDYILMNDIVLSDYSPLNTTLFNSLDGNGYTIHLNSFKIDGNGSLRLALFDTITANTTLKNIRVNIYNGGQIYVNIKEYTQVEIAGFALINEGIIYNCEVVSYFDEEYQIAKNTGDSGLVVKFTNGANTDEIALSVKNNIESKISGFVLENNASIMNSRVGGENFRHIVHIDEIAYLETEQLDVFYLRGQGELSGFINTNAGYISASFVKNIQIDNIMDYSDSVTAGFVVNNSQSIQNSYVEGLGGAKEEGSDEESSKEKVYNDLTNIASRGVIAGFVYENNALVKNSYANIAIENSKTQGSMAAGFVYRNNADATVTLCYAACKIAEKDITQMQFSGVDDMSNPLNKGEISLSYFYNDSRKDDTIQSKITTSAIAVYDVDQKNSFYGFSFSSGVGAYDGIWEMGDNGKISLVAANQIAVSNRYAVTNGKVTSIIYSRNIRDIETLDYVDLSYGSEANPIIIRNAADFAKATGKATTTEISSYKEYYTDTEVSGRYRIVNNIEMTDIAQDAEDSGAIKLTTVKKVFRGLLDGNGFTISNISLGNSETTSDFGLFARLSGAVIMNLDLTVESVHNAQANIVGVLAGTAVNSRIISIKLSPANSSSGGESTAVQGHNIVGGVVGMLFGESLLSDISVSSVDVSSEGFTENKTIGTNKKYIDGDGEAIKSLRELVRDLDNGLSLSENVSNLSYAGAIAGFIDSYSSIDEGFVVYSTTKQVSEYDVVTVRVTDSANIYAEVAGGLFGYVGKSTLIYDATLSVNQNETLTTTGAAPSYIISKNLFAGGLVGENYGGLFAVSAKYADELQNLIEVGDNSDTVSENVYYKQNAGVERGQMSIFSYTPNDEGYATRTNKPIFIGGLVGYMGGGYIYVGQSKLNVISHTGAIAGGVVGLSGVSANRYDLTFTSEKKFINTLYYEVYASGDVYSEGGIASGFIGAIESTGSATGIIAMKNIMATNYYSFTGSSLTADENSPVEGQSSYVSDRHFMLVGGIYEKNALQTQNPRLLSDFYIINSINDIIVNLKDGTLSNNDMGAATVGGYEKISFGAISVDLKKFGFEVPVSKDPANEQKYDASFLISKHVSEDDFKKPSSAYARMKNYFTSNGWDEKYWTHYQNHLFPDIVLLPKVSIDFWDFDNTVEIMQKMNKGSNTIVVRGRLEHNNENCLVFKDIDLRDEKLVESDEFKLTLENFSGRLISYQSYMNSSESGRVTDTNGVGGNVGDRVGIVLKQSLFEEISGNASIEGMTFYFEPENENSGFSLIKNQAENALIRNVDLVVNKKMKISGGNDTSHTDGGNYSSVGLISGMAISTSFYNINIRFRGDDSGIIFEENSENASSGEVYMGLLAGRIRQISASSQMTINGVSIARERALGVNPSTPVSSNPIEITFKTKKLDGIGENALGLYAGLYAGKIEKPGTGAAINIGVRQVNNVKMIIESTSSDKYLNKVSVGGYVGFLANADKMELVEGDSDDENGKGITIYQKCNIETLNAGLAFGEVSTAVQFSFEKVPNAWLIGKYVQGCADKDTKYITINAKVGSIAGNALGSGTNISLASARIKFDVFNEQIYNLGKNESVDSQDSKLSDKEILDRHLSEISQSKYYYDNIHGFSVSGNDDDAFGGIVGFSSGIVSVAGSTNISGNLILDSSGNLSAGGLVGKVAANRVSVDGMLTNSINIYAKANSANVGGLIGTVGSEVNNSDIEINVGDAKTSSIGNTGYTGHVIFDNVSTINFGGAIGKNNAGNKTNINGFAFGGAVRILAKQSGSVTVGGIVGAYAETNENAPAISSTINNCASYGDIFVIYQEYGFTEGEDGKVTYTDYKKDVKLNYYTFGGIVGSAQKGVSIINCSSLMTNFNRETVFENVTRSENGEENVGAIVGKNADQASSDFSTGTVYYSGNKYSSIVSRAFQEQDGNIDCGYGADAFIGYTTATGAEQVGQSSTETQAEKEPSETSANILNSFNNLVSSAVDGSKIKPYIYEERAFGKLIEKGKGDDSSEKVFLDGESNGITWVIIKDNLQGEKKLEGPIAENLTNMAIVGNGKNVEISIVNKDALTSSESIYAGGLIDTMGRDFDTNATSKDTNCPNFNMISGLVLDLDIAQDLEKNDKSNSYGGLVGKMTGNSFIYGVGVKGDLSVGGAVSLELAGVAGELREGRIDQCYVDADITYRGSTTGFVSGVANMILLNSSISSTYSSGKIISYVDSNIYTFANANNKDSTDNGIGIMTISDSYSITQVERNDIFAEVVSSSPDKKIFFMGTSAITRGQVINGTAETYKKKQGDSEENNGYISSESLALSYKDAYKFSGRGLQAGADYNWTLSEGKTQSSLKGDDKGQNTWYFSRLTNYGYASHGFGYLKNSTTYIYDNEEYKPVDYDTLISKEENFKSKDSKGEGSPWYLGVPSVGKFEQMLDTVKPTDDNLAYDKNFKFVLKYGLSLKNNAGLADKSVGKTDKDFVFDGNGNTIDFEDASISIGLFNKVVGTIKNLRLVNVNVEANNINGAGALAAQVDGKIENITATGNIKVTDANIEFNGSKTSISVGGIVGQLKGVGSKLQNSELQNSELQSSKLQSLINITNETENNAIIGGVIGILDGLTANSIAEIDCASSMGILKNAPSSAETSLGCVVESTYLRTGTNADIKSAFNTLHAITGGVVGYVKQSEGESGNRKISDSYNGNSVLSNYGKTGGTEKCNVVSGGVVGYADNVTIENCYNASLVGAGNYAQNSGVNYAGGIVGYAKSGSMVDCINDGAVQALSGVSKYKIKTEIDENSISKKAGTDNDKADSEDLLYKITMTYNPGSARLVNAYGLGYASKNSDFSFGTTNTTSINNIKNDGNIGEFTTISYLLLNRKQILDSDGSNYVGKFVSDIGNGGEETINLSASTKSLDKAKLNVSGFDSYGFPSRVYGTDVISRSLAESNGLVKYLKKMLGGRDSDGITGGSAIASPEYAYNYSSSSIDYSGESVLLIRTSNSNKSTLETAAVMQAHTKYYSSSILSRYWNNTWMNFDGYDAILKHLNEYDYAVGVELHKNTNNEESYIEIEQVNARINDINKTIDQDSQEMVRTINVNGENVGIAKSEANIKTILSPHTYKMEPQTFDLRSDKDIIDWTSIKLKINCSNAIIQGWDYKLDKNSSDGIVRVVGSNANQNPEIYFAEETPEGATWQLSLTLSYNAKLKPFEITSNNSTLSGKKLIVSLENANLSAKDLQNLKNTLSTSNKNVINSVTISSKSKNVEYKDVQVINNSGEYSLVVNGIDSFTVSELNKAALSISMKIYSRKDKVDYVNVDDTKYEDADFTVPSGNEYQNLKYHFKNYITETKKAISSSGWTQSGNSFSKPFANFIGDLGYTTTDVFAYNLSGNGYDVTIYYDGADFVLSQKLGTAQINKSGAAIVISDNNSGIDAQNFINLASGTDVNVHKMVNVYRESDANNPTTISPITETVGPLNLIGEIEGNKLVSTNTPTKWKFELVRYVPTYIPGNSEFATEVGDSSIDGLEVSAPLEIDGVDLKDFKLKAIDITFFYEFNVSVDESKIANMRGYEIRTYRQNKLAGMAYLGGYLDPSELKLNIKLGDRIVINSVGTSYNPSNFELNNFSSELELKIDEEGGKDSKTSYKVEQGIGNIFGYNTKYVLTKKSYSSKSLLGKEVRSLFKVWNNGIVEVEYGVRSADQSDTDGKSIYYIYVPFDISAGESNNGYRITWESISAGFYEYKKDIQGETEITGVRLYDFKRLKDAEDMIEHNFGIANIDSDVVSLGVKVGANNEVLKQGVILARKDIEQNFKIVAKFEYDAYDEDELFINPILLGNPSSVRVDLQSADSVKITGTRKPPEGDEVDAGSDTAKTYTESGTYKLSIAGTKTQTIDFATNSGNAIKPTTYLLLSADISLSSTRGELAKKLIGTNYILQFVSNGPAMFKEVNSSIRDVFLVGINSGENAVAALFAEKLSGIISNVNLYGSIRNIENNNTHEYVEVEGVNETTGQQEIQKNIVFTDYLRKTNSVTIDKDKNCGIINNVTLVGLNAGEGEDVSVSLKAHDFDNTLEKVVLVAGDATIGMNAFDKMLNEDTKDNTYNVLKNGCTTSSESESESGFIRMSDLGRGSENTGNGLQGNDGKIGGSVSVTDKDNNNATGNNIIILTGYSSIGGYGGDGAHGRYIGAKAIGGGKAGAAGFKATSGIFRNDKLKQFNGNSGIGGFGRIVKGDDDKTYYIHTSANGGTESVAGSDGQKIDKMPLNSNVGGGRRAYFGSGISEFCSNMKHLYSHRNFIPKYDEWCSDVRKSISNVTNGGKAVEYGCFSGHGGNLDTNDEGNYGTSVSAASIYNYTHIEVDFWSAVIWVGLFVDSDEEWGKVSWTSGETLNGAGGFTPAANA